MAENFPFAALQPTPMPSGEGDRSGVPEVHSAPVVPYWVELARREFCRRYYEQQFGYLRPQVEMPDVAGQDVRPAL